MLIEVSNAMGLVGFATGRAVRQGPLPSALARGQSAETR